MSTPAHARCKAVVDYWMPRDTNARVEVRVTDLHALLSEIDAWRTELSRVMPPDFKDWFENSPSEWPSVAASVILSLRKQIDFPARIGGRRGAEREPTIR